MAPVDLRDSSGNSQSFPISSHSQRIAKIELRRIWRKTRQDSLQLLALGLLFLIFVLPTIIGGGLIARSIGTELRAGTLSLSTDLVQSIRGGVALLWIGLVLLYSLRTMTKYAIIENVDGLLTTVPICDIVGGILLSQFGLALVWFGPPTLFLAGNFALGAGTILPAITIPLTVTLLLGTAICTGYIFGVWIQHFVTRIEIVTQYKSILGVLLLVLYLALLASGATNVILQRLFRSMQTSPLGWLGEVTLLGVPSTSPSIEHALGALVAAIVALPILVVIAVRMAEMHWYSDLTHSPTHDGNQLFLKWEFNGQFADWVTRLVTRPTGAVAGAVWKRRRRDPLFFAYLVSPLLGLIVFIPDIFVNGRIPAILPVLTVAYMTWVTGAAFTLNPLGDQRKTLPLTLISVRGSQFIRGYILVSVLVGAPVTVALTAGTAVLSSLGVASIIGLTGGSIVCLFESVLLATGIGMRFPRSGTGRLSLNQQTAIPSKTAFLVYSLLLFVGFAVSFFIYSPQVRSIATLFLTVSLPFELVASPGRLLFIYSLFLVILLIIPFISYIYAVRQFERYIID